MSKKTIIQIFTWSGIVLLGGAAIWLKKAGMVSEPYNDHIFYGGLVIILAIVYFARKRFDPEGFKADLIKVEEEEKASQEIRKIKIKRTWGGTICECITAILLIVTWILIIRNHLSAEDVKIAALCTAGAVWFLVSAYFHKIMGFESTTIKQLKFCIYRKRALAILCAILLICACLIPEAAHVPEWLYAIVGCLFVLLFSSKFVMYLVK